MEFQLPWFVPLLILVTLAVLSFAAWLFWKGWRA